MEDMFKELLVETQAKIEAQLTATVTAKVNEVINDAIKSLEALKLNTTIKLPASMTPKAEIVATPSVRDDIPCSHCQKMFTPTTARNIYCSPECRTKAIQSKINAEPERKEYKRDWAKQRREDLAATGKPAKEIRSSLKINHECAWCGSPTAKLYCDEECRKAHEAFASGTHIEPDEEEPVQFKPFGMADPVPHADTERVYSI